MPIQSTAHVFSRILLGIAIGLLSCTNSFALDANNSLISVDSDDYSAQLVQGVYFVEDFNKEITIDNLLEGNHQKQFTQIRKKQFSQGYNNNSFWFKLSIKNEVPHHFNDNSSGKFYLSINKPSLDVIDFYTVHKGGIKSLKTGDKRPFSNRYFNIENYVLPLSIKKQEIKELYIHVQTNNSLAPHLFLEGERAFIKGQHNRNISNGLYFGLAFGLLLFNCLLWLVTRISNYGYYSLVIFSVVMLNIDAQGLLYFLLPAHWGYHQFSVYINAFLIAAATNLFCIKLLNSKENQPKMYLLCKYIIGTCLIAIVLAFVLPIAITAKLVSIISIISMLSVWIVSLIGFSQQQKSAALFFIAQSFFFIGVLFAAAGDQGMHPWVHLTSQALQLSSTFELLFFSLALAYQINEQRKQKQNAQKKFLTSQQEALESKKKLVEGLDQLVEQRTAELNEKNSLLEKINTTDELTGLHNRRYLNNFLPKEYNRAYRTQEPISMLVMDIDFFKRVNDQYGHQVGDRCIEHVAEIILSCLKRESDFAVRYGGEEFIAVLPNTGSKGAVQIANEIKQNIADSYIRIGNKDNFQITISIGVVTDIPTNKGAHETLFRLADDLLYVAKENGRNRVEFALAA